MNGRNYWSDEVPIFIQARTVQSANTAGQPANTQASSSGSSVSSGSGGGSGY